MQHAHSVFTSKHPCVISTVSLLVWLVIRNKGLNTPIPHPLKLYKASSIKQPQATFPDHLKQDVPTLQDLPPAL